MRLQVTPATWRRLGSAFFALGLVAALSWPVIWLWPWSAAANLATATLSLLAALTAAHLSLELARRQMGLKPLLHFESLRFELTWSAYGFLNAVLIANSLLAVVSLPGERVAGVLCVVGLGLLAVELLVRLHRLTRNQTHAPL